MLNSISDIVDVTITQETTTVPQQGFGTMLILSINKYFNQRVKYYANLSEILADGFTSMSNEYQAATLAFSQNPAPALVGIGRRSVDTVTALVSTLNTSLLYTITINGHACTYQASGGDTTTTIAAGLVTAINGASLGVTASNSSSPTVTIAANVANVAYTISVGTDITLGALSASDTVQDDLTNILIADQNWYGLMMVDRNTTDVGNAAAWTEANVKLFGTASADPNILDPNSTSDIAYIFKQDAYKRTFVMYHSQAATIFPEAAWLAGMLATTTGAENWAYKTLAGVPASTLTTSQRTAVLGKNANTYETRGGVNITRLGTTASGEYIDVTVGLDWLASQIQSALFSRLVNLPKIPYTNTGLTIIQGDIMSVLNQAIQRQILSNDVTPVVTMPVYATISPTDKANRVLNNVTFTAVLAGAINAVNVQGFVSF